MKIDRLIGILVVLQQNKKVTAAYLAEKFEVSKRTILRDIEDISKAGIPIVTEQGLGGGISLMEVFSLDTTLFTEQELTAIFTGVKAFDSVSKVPRAEQLAQKIGGNAVTLSDHLMIDLSSFYKDSLAEKIDLIRQAIADAHCISFRYYYERGESDRLIEPYLVVFKWSDWYVFGFCRERQDFRLFKLRRLWELTETELRFVTREIPKERLDFGSNMTDDYIVSADYDPSMKYRLVEEYGPDCFTVRSDGRLHTEWGFTGQKRALYWFLGFGDLVTVTAPEEMVMLMREEYQKLYEKYQR